MEGSANRVRSLDHEFNSIGDTAEMLLSTDSLRMYLTQIARIPLLSAEQEVELSKRIEAGVFAESLLTAWPGSDSKPYTDEYVAEFCDNNQSESDESVDERPAGRSFEDALAAYIEQSEYDSELKQDLEELWLDGTRAKNTLIEANLRLVVSEAKLGKYQRRGLSLQDLIQVGNLGLMRAVEKFDYTRGLKFSTHAHWWIYQAIGLALESGEAHMVSMGRREAQRADKLGRVMRTFAEENKVPTLSDLAREMEMDEEKVIEVQRMRLPLAYLDRPVGEDEDSVSLGDSIEEINQVQPESAVLSIVGSETLEDMLDGLEAGQQLVIRLTYGLGGRETLTTAEVASKYGWTEAYVKQLLRGALNDLRHLAAQCGYEVFLSAD